MGRGPQRGVRTTMRRRYGCLAELGGCGAEPGKPCLSRTGKPSADVHAARWKQYHVDASRRSGERAVGTMTVTTDGGTTWAAYALPPGIMVAGPITVEQNQRMIIRIELPTGLVVTNEPMVDGCGLSSYELDLIRKLRQGTDHEEEPEYQE